MFLGLAWYGWLMIAVVLIVSIPFKIKFMVWWRARQQKSHSKWGEDE